LENTTSLDEYTIQIDHALYPDAMLFAFTYGGTGDATVSVYDENNTRVATIGLKAQGTSTSPNTWPKGFSYIRSTSGEIKTYTMKVSTSTGNAGYAINLGTEETFAECFGGSDNITTVPKNVASPYSVGWISGNAALLEEGEWFHYTASGYTYITASMANHNSLAFSVIDAETELPVYTTKPTDRVLKSYSSTLYYGYVQTGLNLTAGHEYYIKFYTTGSVTPSSLSQAYSIYIGLPCIESDTSTATSSTTYSIAANKETTFKINIDNLPKSTRIQPGGHIRFRTSSTVNNSYITSCTITAPNGKVYTAPNGNYTYNTAIDFENFLTNPNHVPLNGTWTIKIKASRALSDLKFSAGGLNWSIVGNAGN
jgi:hypothetical protein